MKSKLLFSRAVLLTVFSFLVAGCDLELGDGSANAELDPSLEQAKEQAKSGENTQSGGEEEEEKEETSAPSGNIGTSGLVLQWKVKADEHNKAKMALRNPGGTNVRTSDVSSASFSGGPLQGPVSDPDGGIRWYAERVGSAYGPNQKFSVVMANGKVVNFTIGNPSQTQIISPSS